MQPGRGGTRHLDPQILAEMVRFLIEVVEHLHVVREKADRGDHHLLHTLAVPLTEVVENVGSSQGSSGRPLRLW